MSEQTSSDRHRHTLSNAPEIRGHIGVIDIGSNAIRLQVSRMFSDGTYKVVVDDRDPVRLGSDVFRSGKISSDVWNSALKTLKRLAAQAKNRGVISLRAVATSAMREAENGQSFVEEVQRQTGITIEIISGEQEAGLIARGVLAGFRHSFPEKLVLADIGGGSTELSIVERGIVKFSVSLPLGSARLTERFCHSDPLSMDDERELRDFIRDEIHRAIPAEFGRIRELVGSAGTFGAVGNFIRRKVSPPTGQDSRTGEGSASSPRFSSLELSRACSCLCSMTLAERRTTRGFEERRAEIIVAGALLLQEISQFFGIEKLCGARRGLRDGLMLEELEKHGIQADALQPLRGAVRDGRGDST